MILQSRRVVKKYLDKNVMSDNVHDYATFASGKIR